MEKPIIYSFAKQFLKDFYFLNIVEFSYSSETSAVIWSFLFLTHPKDEPNTKPGCSASFVTVFLTISRMATPLGSFFYILCIRFVAFGNGLYLNQRVAISVLLIGNMFCVYKRLTCSCGIIMSSHWTVWPSICAWISNFSIAKYHCKP